jgi:hypothetical protein
MPFEDLIGADIFGAEDLIGTQFAGQEIALGGDPELEGLLGYGATYPGYPIVGQSNGAAMVHPAVAAQAVQRARAQGAAAARAQHKNEFMRTLAARHSVGVVPRPVTKGREYPLGFPATEIEPHRTVHVTSFPQVPFRGRRLVIPSDIAGAVLLEDLKVGKNSMFASANGHVPGRMFTEFAVGVDLNLDTAQISQQISLTVRNTSGSRIMFTASLIGTAVE